MKNFLSRLRSAFQRISDAATLLPLLLLLLLGILWYGTYLLIQSERDNALNSASRLGLEQLNTYEAQVVRVLHEIDQSLKIIQHTYENGNRDDVLGELHEHGLLPPLMVFSIGITDASGHMTASIGWDGTQLPSLDPAFVTRLRQSDSMAIDTLPQAGSAATGMPLLFGLRLNGKDGGYEGAVIVKVDASYFVSSYETKGLGSEGLMGLLTSEGRFLVLRMGNDIVAEPESTQLRPLPASGDETLETSSTDADGIRRHTFARRLYAFPLGVIVGVSEGEQIDKAGPAIRNYLLQAAIASVALVVFFGILIYGNRQLNLSRRREREIAVSHAAQVEHMAYHDTLTGLPNRSFFNKLIHQELTRARRYRHSLSLLFLDLDRFKYINDTLGHDVGDELLVETGRRLTVCLRSSDVVARLGGDEFVVLLPDQPEPDYARIVAERILRAIAEPFAIRRHELRVTVSIGISRYPQDGDHEQALIKHADVAMYQAKAKGKNNFCFYSHELSESMRERMSLESDLRQALQRNEFVLHYQGKFNKEGRISGIEALLRWQHPRLGLLTPARFLAHAETLGLSLPLRRWVTTRACQQLVEWQKQGLPRCRMAVNLTARQFAEVQLLQELQEILAETGLDPALLELEIPHEALLRDLEYSAAQLIALKQLGVRIVVDNFGEGYSSLAALQVLPLDGISLPLSFLQSGTPQGNRIAAAIIALGKALGLEVLAKGVESDAQASFMQRQPCDELQGFFYNKPMAAPEMESVLRRQPFPSIPA